MVREVRVQVEQPGFRIKTLIIATTLLDADEFTKDDLAQLYRQRWNAEASHAHYVQRYTFWQEDEAAYTCNQGIIGSGAMATAMPARHSRRRAMSDVTDDRVPPRA